MEEDLKIAVVCASNLNRSMEAHAILSKRGYNVQSFGAGDQVSLPGTSPYSRVHYEFGTPYDDIIQELSNINKEFYTKNGVLQMLKRNSQVKVSPEKFQDSNEHFGIIITCQKRIYHKVLKWFRTKQSVNNQPVYVINIDIDDTLNGATLGAYIIIDMVKTITKTDDVGKNIDELLVKFATKTNKDIIKCVKYY